MRLSALVAVFFLLTVGCEDPADDVPAAELVDPPPLADDENRAIEDPEGPEPSPRADGPAPMPEGALRIDTASSTFEFVGSKITESHTGHFNDWSGQIDLHPEAVEESRVLITLQMASVEADVVRLTNHLRTDDFFDVPRFPTATFESTGIEAGAEGAEGATHTLSGRLTLRGQTQDIRFPIQLDVTDDLVRAQAEFSINRHRWGISYRGMEDDLIRDDVVIRFDVRAPRG